MNSETQTILWTEDPAGIVTLTFDDPTQSANTMNADYVTSMDRIVARLEEERGRITGVILTSAKRTFFAGGDLNLLLAIGEDEADAYADDVRHLKSQLRRIETLGVPVVAAINGSALGGGLEITLAAHHRIVLDSPGLRLGFPEVTLGLLPGAGGVVRSVRMLGIEPALDQLLLDGRLVTPAKALELGLIDELAGSPEELLAGAKAWINANPGAIQPWDTEGYRVPGGSPADPEYAPVLESLPGLVNRRVRGANYPAPHAILAAAVEGADTDFDSAIDIEGRYFVSVVVSQVAKNMIQAFFFDLQQVKGDRGRSTEGEPFRSGRAVVLGAGVMGAGIAYVCAKAGIEVVLKDVTAEAAERGKQYSVRLVEKAIKRGRLDQQEGGQLLDRITPTSDPARAAGADLLIEAVFEDPELKKRAYEEVEPHLAEGALLASNTSTLPIADLAEGVTRPDAFIGLHFFSPVEKMPLLEIISGGRTSDETVGRALDLARQLGKTPILVHDSRGFFTSRVFATYLDEGMAMLPEGVPAEVIEQASAEAGYPARVLQLSDDINLNLTRRVHEENRAAAEAGGDDRDPHPAEEVVRRMIDDLDRGGRVPGAGFYDYEDGRRTGLWDGLNDAFGGVVDDIPSIEELKERLLFAGALEATRAYGEGVIDSVADANVGSLLGIGFPRWTGGVLQYVNGYPGGPAGFVERARELSARYGYRFDPPESLVEMAENGEIFS